MFVNIYLSSPNSILYYPDNLQKKSSTVNNTIEEKLIAYDEFI